MLGSPHDTPSTFDRRHSSRWQQHRNSGRQGAVHMTKLTPRQCCHEARGRHEAIHTSVAPAEATKLPCTRAFDMRGMRSGFGPCARLCSCCSPSKSLRIRSNITPSVLRPRRSAYQKDEPGGLSMILASALPHAWARRGCGCVAIRAAPSAGCCVNFARWHANMRRSRR